MANVESFDLDHTKVQAPYVRLAGVKTTPRGDQISKYDLRLLQPNRGAIEPAALHTLEHLLAGYLRDHLQNVVDVSPMGCRTGLYLAVIGEPDEEGVLQAFEAALRDTATHDRPIPGVSELECGNYRDHDLQAARQYARDALTQGLKVQKTILLQR
ncbi:MULTISPECIES: S-ribosylhomocysteine lyase [Deinococcus]|uniref:S-ribosylhomocysteine lyase n=1 Tax=Deinococcus geothermalis (strain DSM 11300 / CIP 105573 / AG-3a) TaxID=319795 RepID=LUXS_DEIGD|nr:MULTISPECIES: S-ribosylhomocysteine lyase [Deinococcus]Q1IW42.2 RecName: Full=S-ribosylhomocysteine lyase; AltName: Full=AI-2 synthesis protein; AltName: Full=Autoinducer-2 production protein LuxS [Deinococcus geothermalis DSM 11300]MBI0445069.1 S-ribosylhomocysteine lyase [Deinococcus sp. DB0503]